MALRRAWALVVVLAGSLGPLPVSAQIPVAAPAPAPAAVPTTTNVASATATPPNTVERARQGVVVLERQGRPLALGAVLDGDGRILTALSPLGAGNFLSARYHDGSVVPLKLVHSDRGWDLALLAPVSDKPIKKAGLRAGKQASFVGLQGFALIALPNTITAQPAALKLAPGMLGGDSKSLAEAYELGARPAYVGGPIVNSAGEVMALVARACPVGAGIGCAPAPYGAPVTALKQFLRSVPAEASWLGVEVVGDELKGVRGVRVSAVAQDSPAAAAGLRPGSSAAQADLIVAVDGAPVASLVELNEAVRSRVAGDSIELLLFGMGRYRHVSVKPRPAPERILPPVVAPKPTKPRTPNPYR
jgi:serine protease Do